MNGRQILKYTGIGLAAGAVLTVAGYAATIVLNRTRYGGAQGLADPGADSLLDRFIPEPEIVEHHHIAINAPADVVLSAAKEIELLNSPMVRALIRARELTLGGEPDARPHPPGLLAQMLSIGWVVLSERAGREVVLGAVTRPWETRPVFRSIPADQFREFSEPGFVKIAWTLRADPVDDRHSVFHTETRVSTTDTTAREHFRTYWSFVAPGVRLIRLALLRPLRRDAERRASRRAA